MNVARKFRGLTRDAAFVVTLAVSRLAAEEVEVNPDLQAKIIAGCLAEFREVSSLEFATTTRTVFASAYLARNPHRVKLDHLTTVYDGVLADERYRVSSAMTYADGQRIPAFLQTFDGTRYNYFAGFGQPWMLVKRSFVVDSDNSFELGTTALLPFTFLYLTSDDYFVPNLSIKRVTDEAAWAEVFKKARVVDTLPDAGLMRIRFTHLGGTSYVVTLSTDDGYYPIGFEKYGPGGLAQRYLIEEFATAQDVDKRKFRYSKKAKFESFLNGWPRNTITIETTRLTLNAGTKDVVFAVEPGLAVNTIDADDEKAP